MLTSNVSMQHLGSASPDVRAPSRSLAHVHISDALEGQSSEGVGRKSRHERIVMFKTVTTYFSFSSLCDFETQKTLDRNYSQSGTQIRAEPFVFSVKRTRRHISWLIIRTCCVKCAIAAAAHLPGRHHEAAYQSRPACPRFPTPGLNARLHACKYRGN